MVRRHPLHGQHDRLVDRHGREEGGVLEGADQAEPGSHLGTGPADVLPLEMHRAPVLAGETAENLEQGGLAGPVRADQTQDLAGADLEVDGVDGGEAPEAFGQFLGDQNGLALPDALAPRSWAKPPVRPPHRSRRRA